MSECFCISKIGNPTPSCWICTIVSNSPPHFRSSCSECSIVKKIVWTARSESPRTSLSFSTIWQKKQSSRVIFHYLLEICLHLHVSAQAILVPVSVFRSTLGRVLYNVVRSAAPFFSALGYDLKHCLSLPQFKRMCNAISC